MRCLVPSLTRLRTHSWPVTASLCPHLYTGKVLVIISAPYTPGFIVLSSSSSLMQHAVVSSFTSPRYLQIKYNQFRVHSMNKIVEVIFLLYTKQASITSFNVQKLNLLNCVY